MSLLSQSCAEATRLISESQDSPLSLTARVGLRLHLVICRHCQRYKRQIHLIRHIFQEYPDNLSQMNLPDQARHQIVRELERAGY